MWTAHMRSKSDKQPEEQPNRLETVTGSQRRRAEMGKEEMGAREN